MSRAELEKFWIKLIVPWFGDYWDARIANLFLEEEKFIHELGIKYKGINQTGKYRNWVVENYPQFKEFSDFCLNLENANLVSCKFSDGYHHVCKILPF